jgi:hypothetical protein
VYTGMLSACAAKSGWVGVARARLWRACLVSGRGKASSRRARKAIVSLRGEAMIYCGEMMMHLLIMCIDISADAIIYGLGF